MINLWIQELFSILLVPIIYLGVGIAAIFPAYILFYLIIIYLPIKLILVILRFFGISTTKDNLPDRLFLFEDKNKLSKYSKYLDIEYLDIERHQLSQSFESKGII